MITYMWAAKTKTVISARNKTGLRTSGREDAANTMPATRAATVSSMSGERTSALATMPRPIAGILAFTARSMQIATRQSSADAV